MDLVELLSVADRMELRRIGVAVMPDFALPPGGWRERFEAVLIVRPDGTRLNAMARFAVVHFNARAASLRAAERWRLTVAFPALSGRDVPIGSRVMVAPSLKTAIEEGRAPGD